jgi:hypothetical protein
VPRLVDMLVRRCQTTGCERRATTEVAQAGNPERVSIYCDACAGLLLKSSAAPVTAKKL